MTIGIVLVACFAARIAGGVEATRTSTLSCYEFSDEAWDTIRLSLKVAVLDQDVFALDITEIPQPLSECFVRESGLSGSPTLQVSYSRNFLWLLRLG